MSPEFETSYDHSIITRTGDYENITTHFHGTVEEAVELSRRLQNLVHGGEGISEAAYNAALDRYLSDGTGETDLFVRMSKEQQKTFQDIKKSKKRLAYKSKK